ncbi:MAG: carbamoyltransferase [Vicinamibacterales bacterium]|nr:carbamoyltransferase [Vicinamibacterales bacterium]
MAQAPVTTLGLSAFYHDSAAAIARDHAVVAAAQEERFTRRKHDAGFPQHAIDYCLGEAFVEASELDAVIFYDDPVRTLDRAVRASAAVAPEGRAVFVEAATSLLQSKVWVEPIVREALGSLGKHGRLLCAEHHCAHAASAFYPSPFNDAAILTLDGVGEWATTTLGMGSGNRIELLQELDYPHSLGLLYSAFTAFCGFKVNSGEYKLMGLAPYGRPVYADAVRTHLIDVKADGSFRLNMGYFAYLAEPAMTNDRFAALFGGPAREPESRISRREMDLAASIQAVTEDVVVRLARTARQLTGARNLVMAGGVALNCVANGKLLREGVVEGLWIQPAAGDAGGALGAALLANHMYFDRPRPRADGRRDGQRGSYLGPAYSSDEVRACLSRHQAPFDRVEDPAVRASVVAETLAVGKVVGLCSGRMEFGPRSLGARSILGDPRKSDTQAVMNLKIKFRESFRPFAPAVLRERVADYFELDADSPYMLLVAPVRESRRLPFDVDAALGADDDLLPAVNTPRSDIPAVTHVDYSARVQTVHADTNPEFHRIISAFEHLTGCAVVVNTSFNVRGEPIVCSPEDAYRCFMRTDMDLLVLEDCLVWKAAQPKLEGDEDWRSRYALD